MDNFSPDGKNDMAVSKTRAYLVLGPESSGTRLMTRLLLAAGCLGDPDHTQRFDTALPPANGQPLVWRRSVPHAHQWPDIGDLVQQLSGAGYVTQAIVMNRTWWALLPGQVGTGHVTTEQLALDQIRRAYPHIFGQLWGNGISYVVVSYEALVQAPAQTMQHAFGLVGLEWSASAIYEDIWDENAKWLADD